MSQGPSTPAPEHFDLIIVGSGSGNSIVDERFADQRVALIDHGTFGGTCLNVGCIPTKMFVYPADVAREAARLPQLGVDATVGATHWAQLRDRIFGRIDPISVGGKRWRQESANVEVLEDTASFVAPKTLRVGRRLLTADQIVLANGSRTWDPGIPGLDEAASRVHTSDSIMRVERLPRSMIILGGGFVAAEFAHVFSTFGTRVTVINRSDTLLRAEDRDIATRFTHGLARHVTVQLRQRATNVEATNTGVIVTTQDDAGDEYEYDAEVLLVAMGRVPNADTLDCEAGGVDLTTGGYIVVDEHQRTTAPGVYALGDVCSPLQLKHVANHQARVVQHNLLHPDDLVSANLDAVPHAVFAEPQVAAVGLTEAAARARGLDVVTALQDVADVAYGWAMAEEPGEHVVKIVADRATGELVGAHIVGPQASILLQPLVQALALGPRDVHTLARGQYWPHPALSEVVENALLGIER